VPNYFTSRCCLRIYHATIHMMSDGRAEEAAPDESDTRVGGAAVKTKKVRVR
jgi:hypothetical protein